MIILECGARPEGQEPRVLPVPKRILDTARWWTTFRPRTGNLENVHPGPLVVEHTDEAKDLLIKLRRRAETEYGKAEEQGDAVGTTVWGRASEHIRKLALLYTVSENHENPVIGKSAVDWAGRFVMHGVQRMLFMAQAHVANGPFDAECLRAMNKLREAPGRMMPRSGLLRCMKIEARALDNIMATLEQRGDVQVQMKSTGGRPGTTYKLVRY